MYHKILVALDHTDADRSLLPHVEGLARQLGSELVLLHVADGWAARNYDRLRLAESEEIKSDRAYLEMVAATLTQSGIKASCLLAMGNPPTEILKMAEGERCDLIAMTSHGHRWLADLFLGSTINEVRHKTEIPILVVRAQRSPKP